MSEEKATKREYSTGVDMQKNTWKTKLLHFLKRGDGDSVAFIWLTPVVIGLLVMLLTYSKYVSVRQKMEYTAYFTCRAASVCDSLKEAQKRSLTVAKQNLNRYVDIIDPGSIRVELTTISGDGKKAGARKKQGGVKKASAKKTKTAKWDKGNYVQCVLTVMPKTGNILVDHEMKETITLAIESDQDYVVSDTKTKKEKEP